MYFFRSSVLIILCLLAFNQLATAQKLKAEEIIAKHIAAVGPADKRAVKNRVVMGSVEYSILVSGGMSLNGQSVLAFEETKSVLGMAFQNPRYPQDKMGFDGNKVKVGFITPGQRSALGRFVVTYPDVLSEGLFGGVLSGSWPFYDLAARKARVEADGIRKIDGRETYVVSYLPKGGSDLTIKLFFDQQTFRHVRTEYRKIINAQQGRTVDSSASQRELRVTMTETYSDFKMEDGVDLPHTLMLEVSADGQSGTETSRWKMNFDQFYINQKLEPATFVLD